MRFLYPFFGIDGRLSRQQYAARIFILPILVMLPIYFTFSIVYPEFETKSYLSIIPAVALLACVCSLSIRRLHDRGKSGWWLIVYMFIGPSTYILSESYFVGTAQKIGVIIGLSILFVGLVELFSFPSINLKNQYGAPKNGL